ncbi:MAG TPA: HYR domain-containing protein, partial [Thermoanaerobaculia bacterium]
MRRIVVALASLFVVFPLFGSISSISPSTLYVGDVEEFVSIQGSGLVGSESTRVFFTSPSGSYSVEPNNADPALLVVAVPFGVSINVGKYDVTVQTKNTGQATVTQGPIEFDVIERPVGGPPLLALPEFVIAEADSANGAIVTYTAFATSANGDQLAVTCDHASGGRFVLGTTSVHCTASDTFGSAAGGFFVVVTDTVPPVLTLPDNIATDNPVVTYTATATDNIDGPIVPSCSPASGSTFPGGVTKVRCIAHDSHANQTVGTFTVTVAGPPSLEVPVDITAEATSAAGAVVQYVVASDAGVDALCTPLSGSTFPLGTTIVHCSATNTHGTTNGSFNITVEDTTPPVVTVPADISTFATSPLGATVNFTASATDTVDGPVAISCKPMSGTLFAIDTTLVFCTAKDAHGNIGTNDFHITVTPVPPPTLNLPPNITAEATGPNGAAVTYTVTATGGATPVCSPASGSTFALGTTTVQCSATNSSGTANGSFTVTVVDTKPPVLTLPAPITAEATSASGAPVSFSATAVDLVDGPVGVLCTPASGSTFPLGLTTVSCSAKDAHNNTATGAFTIIVRDTTPPTIVKITASSSNLWPPNHNLEPVTIHVIAIDLVDPAPVSHIISVSSNQPANG